MYQQQGISQSLSLKHWQQTDFHSVWFWFKLDASEHEIFSDRGAESVFTHVVLRISIVYENKL